MRVNDVLCHSDCLLFVYKRLTLCTAESSSVTIPDMKRAFGYVRVSSASQAADDRDGIPRQKETIRRWATANGVRIVEWFTDAYSGAKELEDRAQFQRMLLALHGDSVKLVVIEKLDRLARDLMLQESIVADFQRNGFELVSAMEPDLCSTDPTRVMVRQILGVFAQYERSMIVQKLRGARQRARLKNPDYREGRKPFGVRAGEPETIERIRFLRSSGMTLAAICERLAAEGYKPRADGGRWHERQIARILERIPHVV